VKPAFKITADKKDVTALIAERLVSISITDETGLVSDTCEILLDNRGYALEIPPRGANLEISLGYEGKPLTRMGAYIVDDVEVFTPPAQMRISAKASNSKIKNLSKNIKAPKSRSWHKYTLVGIIRAIALEHNFEGVIDDYFKQIYISHLDQTDESDISFLNGLASDYGAFVKLALGRLLFFRKGASVSASGKELPITKISEKEITNWNLKISDLEKFGKVIAKWHNFTTGKEENVFVGTGDPPYNLRYKFVSKEKALAAAESKFFEFLMGSEKLSLSLVGNPSLSAENKLIISDIKYLKDKRWVIESVNHQLSDQGFTSQVNAKRLLPKILTNA
jgi:phage protein D